MSLVNISIVGNLVKQPEQKSFSSGKVKTTLVVAVDAPNRKREDNGRNDSDFYRVEAWGKLGDIAHKYLEKGNIVGATGRLVMDHWQDRDGRTRVTPIVEADQIALPPKPKAGQCSNGTNRTNLVTGVAQFDGSDAEVASTADEVASTDPQSEASPAPTAEPAVSVQPIPNDSPREPMPYSADEAFDTIDDSFVAEDEPEPYDPFGGRQDARMFLAAFNGRLIAEPPPKEYQPSKVVALPSRGTEDDDDAEADEFAESVAAGFNGQTIRLTEPDASWLPEPLKQQVRKRG